MFGFYPASVLSYNAQNRTAQVSIKGVTDGSSEGLPATFAYPVGHDDTDTELQVLDGAEVYVFFEAGHMDCPVIAFYRSHGTGATVGVRRIRQKRIELVADDIVLMGKVRTTDDVQVDGTLHADVDVVADTVSSKNHVHGGVKVGEAMTAKPII